MKMSHIYVLFSDELCLKMQPIFNLRGGGGGIDCILKHTQKSHGY